MKVFLSNFNKVINTKIRVPFPFLDVYIFKWNKCSHSGIHDHADKGCLMFLAKGEMEEYVYTNKLKYLYTNIHKSPTITFINNNIGYHSIKPIRKSLSIHFYYPKNYKTKYFIK